MSIVSLDQATVRLRQGDVVAIPTETVYGLAATITREESLRQIFTVKQRPFFDPLIVHVADVSQARGLVTQWPAIYDDLTRLFWPGPLTLIAPKGLQISSLITSGLNTVALRAPNHPVALELIRQVGPLAAPSANRFGRTSPTCAKDVDIEFNGQIPIVDGGSCEVGVESTVLAVEGQDKTWQINILRPGGVSRKQLQAALSPLYKISFARVESQASPGHLKAHYQPANPVVLVESGAESRLPLELAKWPTIPQGPIHWLNLARTPEQAARELYSQFRQLSSSPGVIAILRRPETSGEDWEAIWDRAERASILTVRRA